MKTRCLDTNRHDYPRYGGSGITVCTEWQNSFLAFLQDIGPAPTPEHSLDRICPFLGYFRENCRWATPQEQRSNRRNDWFWRNTKFISKGKDGKNGTTTQEQSIDCACDGKKLQSSQEANRGLIGGNHYRDS